MGALLLAMDRGQASILFLLDLSAAFFTVDREIWRSRLRVVAGVQGMP